LVTTQPLADGFESAGLYSYDVTQSTQVNAASVASNSTKKLFGSYSNQFSYSFAQPIASVTYKTVTPTVTVNRNKVLGIHIYGDLSGNELQLQFTSGTDVRFVKLCDINFFGWEFVETRLLSLLESTDYQLTGFKVIRKDGVLSGNGDMCFDNMLLYDTPLMAVWNVLKDKVKIYPNPVSDMLHVTVDNDEIPTLQLYAINGILVKEIKAKEMNVSDIATGTYILKIRLKDSFGTYTVMISRFR
jgi:hypothetical protein